MGEQWVRFREKYYVFTEKVNWAARGAAGYITGGGVCAWVYSFGEEYLWPALFLGGVTLVGTWEISGFLDEDPIGRRKRIVEDSKDIEYEGKGEYEL